MFASFDGNGPQNRRRLPFQQLIVSIS